MLRIGQVESSATADGKYTDGSVAGGIAATRLRAAAFNAIQEELANIVESAGMTLSPDDMTQVLTALKKQFLSRTNPFADIKSDGTAAVATALSNLGFGQSVAREGYLIWPGGLIMQWGTLTGDQGNLGAGYPIAFKERAFQALTSMNDKTAGAVDGITLYVPTANLNNKTSLIALNKGKDLLGTVTASYFVIGK